MSLPSATELPAVRERLRDLIAARSVSRGTAVTLASGRTSDFYVNMKATMLHAQGAHDIAALIIAALGQTKVTHVGGLEMGAVPLASAVAALSITGPRSLQAFFVRKAAKEHGTQSLIEGLARDETLKDADVAVLEDVTTTGGSALRAVDLLRDEGAHVATVITVVDRLEGAGEAFAQAGVPFQALLTAHDFGR